MAKILESLITALLLAFILVMLGAVWFSSEACVSKWPQLKHRYGIISGCMIEVPGKGWMPAENYRVL